MNIWKLFSYHAIFCRRRRRKPYLIPTIGGHHGDAFARSHRHVYRGQPEGIGARPHPVQQRQPLASGRRRQDDHQDHRLAAWARSPRRRFRSARSRRGKLLDGKAPSKELGFHSGILRERKDANAVFHFQSTYATAVACMKETAFNFHIIPEIPHFIGTPAYVEYHTPGSRELARGGRRGRAGPRHGHPAKPRARDRGRRTRGRDPEGAVLRAGLRDPDPRERPLHDIQEGRRAAQKTLSRRRGALSLLTPDRAVTEKS